MPPINVEKLAQEADELHRKMYPEQYGDPPLPPEGEPGTPAPPAPAPPTDPSGSPGPAPEGAGEPPAAPAEGTPPAPPADPSSNQPAPAPAPPTPPAENWEGRYNALQGKYNAEVPRLAAEVAALKQRLAEVSTPPAQPAQPTPTAPQARTKVSMTEVINSNPELKEQFEAFSVDYPDVAKLMTGLMEAATEASAIKVNERVEQVQGSIKNVEQVAIESKVNAFWNVVNNKMPDWETTKNDPEFSVYLGEVDPISGLQRGVFAQDAITKLDANRVLAIYSDFRKTRKKSDPVPDPNPTPSSTPPSSTNVTNPAAALVAPPSGNRPAAPSNIPADQPITAAFIQKFYNDAALGKYRGKDKEFAATEARINKAVHEGKVVG